MEVHLTESGLLVPMVSEGNGYFAVCVQDVAPGALYLYRIDGELERPDPASRSQPRGVHGPSRVVDLAYAWQDAAWRGLPLWRYVIYEVHVGTFSRTGDFAGVMGEVERLRQLGVSAIEIMPVAQFPGSRNWGYDGVYPFAVQDTYGGAGQLQQLVDTCHREGIAVVLDVVYNHLGPEGNYLSCFGPYFTDRYKTPWGGAMNFDDAHSDEVRRYFIDNAIQWIEEFHIDALRLDAVHAIFDQTARPFLEELAEAIQLRARELGRSVYLMAESDLNDPKIVRSRDIGGYGLDAMWCDDFHHAVHSLLTGEVEGYYRDFGTVQDLAVAFRTAMSRPGEYSQYRKRRHGRRFDAIRPEQCVVFVQNHDQVGNRMLGERLSALVGFECEKLAAAIVCLSPFIPLIFMGQEYGEVAPFQYFVSHGDERLIESVRQGRLEEFSGFMSVAEAPDPAAPETFQRCILNDDLRHRGRHEVLYRLYTRLLELRQHLPELGTVETMAIEGDGVMMIRSRAWWWALCFGSQSNEVVLPVSLGKWRKVISSSECEWGGPGDALPTELQSLGQVRMSIRPHSFVVYARDLQDE